VDVISATNCYAYCKMPHVINTPVAQLYANVNTLTLTELHDYQILKFVHKFVYH